MVDEIEVNIPNISEIRAKSYEDDIMLLVNKRERLEADLARLKRQKNKDHKKEEELLATITYLNNEVKKIQEKI
jgi:chorismate mutase